MPVNLRESYAYHPGLIFLSNDIMASEGLAELKPQWACDLK